MQDAEDVRMDEIRPTKPLVVRTVEVEDEMYRVLLLDLGAPNGKSRLSHQDMDPWGPEVERRGRSDMH